jgi:hypothetical protein
VEFQCSRSFLLFFVFFKESLWQFSRSRNRNGVSLCGYHKNKEEDEDEDEEEEEKRVSRSNSLLLLFSFFFYKYFFTSKRANLNKSRGSNLIRKRPLLASERPLFIFFLCGAVGFI